MYRDSSNSLLPVLILFCCKEGSMSFVLEIEKYCWSLGQEYPRYSPIGGTRWGISPIAPSGVYLSDFYVKLLQ